MSAADMLTANKRSRKGPAAYNDGYNYCFDVLDLYKWRSFHCYPSFAVAAESKLVAILHMFKVWVKHYLHKK